MLEGGGDISKGPEPRVNERIRAKKVRLIKEDGSQVDVLPLHEALRIAEEQGLDLVEVAPQADPPVCKMMDYGKYKYELKKAQAEKKQKAQTVKEIKFRPNIGEHDFEFKISHIREFLEEGHKTRIRVFFKGRQIVHPELGKGLIERIVESISDVGMVDQPPKMEGKNLVILFAPKKRAKEKPRGEKTDEKEKEKEQAQNQ